MSNNRVKSLFDIATSPFEPLDHGPLAHDPFAWIFGNIKTPKASLNIYEQKDHYEIAVDAPGFSKEELNVSVNSGLLTITGKKSKNTHRSEIRHSIALGDNVDSDKIEAEHKDGVLTIKIPKAEDQSSHDIEIK